ncbi:hypothetical protein [Bradyrhizobium sp. OAE829]|uniref:hypothetical protein n=1 Tax=Bradyrhizobium sp. OAE829 TaxID=2663807 RepID=UPI00178C102D
MFHRLLEFVWTRYSHYEIVEPCTFTTGDGERWEFGRRIITIAKSGDEYYPLKDYPYLYRAFANVRNDQLLLDFVKLYGPLTDEGLTPSSPKPHFTSSVLMLDGRKLNEVVYVPGDQIDRCLKEASWCAHILRYHAKKSPQLHASIKELEVRPSLCTLEIEADPVNGVRMVLEPKCLLDAIKLQLLESISNGVNTFECAACGDWFSKKSGAKFCSEKCKDSYHNAKNKKQRAAKLNVLRS